LSAIFDGFGQNPIPRRRIRDRGSVAAAAAVE